MNVAQSGSQPSSAGPEEWFTGTVRLDAPFQARPPARVAGTTVTFEPGARTAWHVHPLGQHLFVTAGCGLVQRQGAQPQAIRPGDVVRIDPGELHWHGAAPVTAMTHIAVLEMPDASTGEPSTLWREHVAEGDYRAAAEEAGVPLEREPAEG